MRPDATRRRNSGSRNSGSRDSRPRPGFTLVELLTVIGLIALLLSLFMPVLGKVRAAANTTGCVSNLRQVGVAWTMYVAENHGRLPDFTGTVAATPDVAWRGYWPGIAQTAGVKGESLLCPAARTTSDLPHGYGNVSDAWNGKGINNGGTYRMTDQTARVSSYGYNRHLTSGSRVVDDGAVVSLNALQDPANVPAFLDCAHPDARPASRGPNIPEASPPNLSGEGLNEASPGHWRFLLGRHGRGINVYMADGSARWVRLEDTYLLTWKPGWMPYRLRLPAQ